MKYLQDDRLSALTARFFFGGDDDAGGGGVGWGAEPDDAVLLGGGGGGDRGGIAGYSYGRRRRVWGRLEAYTMKRAGTDKKYAADLGSKYVTLQQQLEDRLAARGVGSSSSSPLSPEEAGGGPWGMVLPPLLPSKARHSSAPATRPRDSSGAATATEASAVAPTTTTTTTVKRRSQSVGFQDDNGGGPGGAADEGSNNRKKKARSRSNSLDESNLVVYRTNLGDFAAQETRRLMTDLILTLNMSFPDYDFDCVSPNDFERCPLPDVIQNVDSLLGELAADHRHHHQPLPPPVASAEDGAAAMTVPPTLPTASQPTPQQPQPGLDTEETGLVSGGDTGHDCHDNDDDDDTAGNKGIYPKDHLLSELWSALDHVVHLSDCEVYLWKNHPENLLQGPEGEDEPVLWGFHYLFVNKPLKRIVFFGCCETLRNNMPDSSLVGDDAMDEDDIDNAGGQYSYVDRNSLDRPYPDDEGATGDADDDVELVSDDEDNDDDDEEEDESSRLRYTRILSSGGGDGSDVDFDLDPSAMAAGGIPISTA